MSDCTPVQASADGGIRPQMIEIVLNGATREVSARTTLRGLVDAHGLPPKATLVECNGEAVPPASWASHILAQGDRVELLRIVAGG